MRTLSMLSDLARLQKRLAVFAIDVAMLVIAVWVAYSLRVGVWELSSQPVRILIMGGLAFMIPTFWFGEVYNTIFRYAGVGMLRTIVPAFAVYSCAMFGLFMVIGIDGVPRTMGILQPAAFFLLVVATRICARFFFIDVLRRGTATRDARRVMIFGAGREGQQLASSIRSDPNFALVGFIDDDIRLSGQRLDGYRVFPGDALAATFDEHKVTDVLLALPHESRARRRAILEQLGQYQVEVKTLPRTWDIVDGQVSLNDIRPVDIEDLLGRDQVQPNELLIARTVNGNRVLVSGAGGSIGSELCRQIVRNGASRIILFEVSEFALYSIERELRAIAVEEGLSAEIVPVLGSVCDAAHLAQVFAAERPQTVYHAAAYKHVPLVEANVLQGIQNNVLGTAQIAQAAIAARVRDFILVSTDKAVRPTNVMGATKRVAEQILQNLAMRGSRTCFSMVRFGNVLGSSGSVVPLFRNQIEAGGPITLTDKRITRYFMTVPEAANLVLQAGGLAKGGEVFLLDMGEPVKIIDLARSMIRLSGLTPRDAEDPAGDIEIVEVGLRPGEKLYEELLIDNNARATRHGRIKMAREACLPPDRFDDALEALLDCRDPGAAIKHLHRLVPEFAHAAPISSESFDPDVPPQKQREYAS